METPAQSAPGWRVQAVLALLRGIPWPQVAQRFGIGRSDLYKYRRRALDAIETALVNRSRGPKRPAARLAPEIERQIATVCQRHPTWSSHQVHDRLGPEAPPPRTIQRVRRRLALPRLPKREAPRTQARRLSPAVKAQARQAIATKPDLGPERLAWELYNQHQIRISPATIKRMKRTRNTQLHPPEPAPTWRFYERKHSHSLWHGDCMEKVILADSGQQVYQLTLLDDYSRGYVYCDLLPRVDPRTTTAALICAMRQWQIIPKQVLFDNGGPFRGHLLQAFCDHLHIQLIHETPYHPQTNGKLERAFRDDLREFYRHYEAWYFDELRRDLPAYVHYRNTIRGHRALGGRPAMTRLEEQNRMALPWVLDQLEGYAWCERGQKKVLEDGSVRMLRRYVYLDEALARQRVTCYETLDGLEVRSEDQCVYLLRDYRTWFHLATWNFGHSLPEDLRFERCDGDASPRIAVAL